MSKEPKSQLNYSAMDHFRPAADIVFREAPRGESACDKIGALLMAGNTALALRMLRKPIIHHSKHAI